MAPVVTMKAYSQVWKNRSRGRDDMRIKFGDYSSYAINGSAIEAISYEFLKRHSKIRAKFPVTASLEHYSSHIYYCYKIEMPKIMGSSQPCPTQTKCQIPRKTGVPCRKAVKQYTPYRLSDTHEAFIEIGSEHLELQMNGCSF